jgi:YHS domain-containing protein
MKNLLLLFLYLVSTNGYGQTEYNQEDGFVANGFDVVSYFNNAPKKGNSKFIATYESATFRFVNEVNLKKFREDPERYAPQYGGWCAYAVGANNSKVTIDPETYEVRNGKLYLFYNAFFNNTHSTWIKEGADELIRKGDKNWVMLKSKK